MKSLVLAGVAALLAACSTPYPPKDLTVQRNIEETLKQASAPKAPAPVTLPPGVGHSLLPPLRDTLPRTAVQQPEPRFDLSVTDASIHQVLNAIAADTRYSILLSPKFAAPKPAVAGGQPDATAQAASSVSRDLITVRLKNVTVFEALDAIRDTYGYEYSVSGTRIYVEPPDLQTRLYQVNYTLGQRRGVSDLQVVSGAANGGGSGSGSSGSGSSGSSTTTSGGGGGSSYASTQASALSTVTKSDLWGEMEDSLRTILGCQIPRLQASAARAGGQGGQGGGGSSAGSSSRADVSYAGEAQLGERLRGVDGCTDGRAVNVNQMTGTVLVRGMPRELRVIERLLRRMQLNIERQVVIEAKVIDVQLNKDAQQGINWAALHHDLMRAGVGTNPALVGAPGTTNSGRIVNGISTGDLLGSHLLDGTVQSAFSAGLGIMLQGSQFAALISFLQTQGDVHVLSSPRIATLNNQKAVIKVGTEEPFVTNIAPGSTSLSAAASITLPPTLTYQPFFSGISLDVTPQIDERDRVTLHVHAMVNSIAEKQKISSPVAGAAPVPLAVNSVNETDSMVKTADGMMVVIGGLMTERSDDSRSAIPGLGDVPVAGALFRKGTQSSSKRELVILIKPSVVKMDADWGDDIASTGRRIQGLAEAGLDARAN